MASFSPTADPTDLDLFRVGRTVGILILVQLATGLLTPYIMLVPLTGSPATFLESAARMETQVRLSVLLLLVGGAVPVAASIALWPVVRSHRPRLGLWLGVIAVTNFVLQLVENAHWLWMLSVSQTWAAADSDTGAVLSALAPVVRSAWRWAHYSHILIVVGWLFLFFSLVYRCRLAPRALPAFGMAVCGLHFAGITLPAFAGYRMPLPELFGMPLGLAILLLGGWLVARGFSMPAPREVTA